MSSPKPEHSEPAETMLKKLKETVDPFGIAETNWEVWQAWMGRPKEFADVITRFSSQWWEVQLHALQRLAGVKEQDAIPSVAGDERFTDPVWTDNPIMDAVKEHYLLYTRNLVDAYYQVPDVPGRDSRRAAFWAKQWLNVLAPTNYFLTNPVAISKAIESGGDSLLKGMNNWARDLIKGGDIKMVDESQFRVGGNIANTPGQVVFRNDLLEVIQYTPTTAKVREMPIVLVSPWINKFYILDLDEQSSMVRYLVGKGFTVFVTSWKNPTREMRDTSFDDYVVDGVQQIVKVACDIAKVEKVHLVGYCIGGTAVSSYLAWANRGARSAKEVPVAHWTLFASLVDFDNPGELEVFIDEEIVDVLDDMMAAEGYLDSKELLRTFRMLRSNSLIWRYFVHNYLYGETPPPIAVLYWNMDGTRLPRAMHAWYLREFYLKNNLVKKDAVTIDGRPIDLARIKQPLTIVGTEEDHITPWKQTFRICQHVGGPVRYVLASSGHILGIINPPAKAAKRRYWAGEAQGETDPDKWLARQTAMPGSWWEEWTAWLAKNTGPEVAPPKPAGKYKPLCPAPGSYVLER
jgi:polyhydroxyalkanoate synthase